MAIKQFVKPTEIVNDFFGETNPTKAGVEKFLKVFFRKNPLITDGMVDFVLGALQGVFDAREQ